MTFLSKVATANATQYGAVGNQVDPMKRQQGPNRDLDVFPTRHYDISECADCLPCCSKTLHMKPREVEYVRKDYCGTTTEVRLYSELGSVNTSDRCGCCYGWSSDLFPLVGTDSMGTRGEKYYNMPGCFGCGKKELRDEITTELKNRMRAYGNEGLFKPLGPWSKCQR